MQIVSLGDNLHEMSKPAFWEEYFSMQSSDIFPAGWAVKNLIYISSHSIILVFVGFIYSWLSLSRSRLSRITAYLEVKIWSLSKHENLTKEYCEKEEKLLLRSNFSSFPQYFQYISNFKSPVTHIIVKCGCSSIFFSFLQIWYVEVWIFRSISEIHLEFEITRVDCSLFCK